MRRIESFLRYGDDSIPIEEHEGPGDSFFSYILLILGPELSPSSHREDLPIEDGPWQKDELLSDGFGLSSDIFPKKWKSQTAQELSIA